MSSGTSRWMLFTSIGLGVGIAAGLLLQQPIEAVVGMILVTPVITVLVGAVLGASQWLEVRRHVMRAHRWLPATAVGLGAGLAVGVVAVEVLGQAILGQPFRLLTLSPAAQSASMLVVGAIAGAVLGSVQRLWVRSLPAAWPLLSAVGLGCGLSLGAALANGFTGAISSPAGFILLVVSAGAVLGASTARLVRGTA